eukprot:Skav202424  [mRNA]  locus=scaffold1370:406032:406643:- [translate_table: standard]
MSPSDLWHLGRAEKEAVLGKDRSVQVTEEAAAKESGPEGKLESVFSASALPVCFYQDMIRGHSAVAVLDLAVGQGNFARACLLERVPYYAFSLTELHAKKVEMNLTQWMLSELKKEGGTHYRPEAVEDAEEAETEKKPAVPKPKTERKKRAKTDNNEDADGGSEPPKKQPKSKAKGAKKDKDDGDDDEGQDEGAGEGNSPLPW